MKEKILETITYIILGIILILCSVIVYNELTVKTTTGVYEYTADDGSRYLITEAGGICQMISGNN